MNTIKSKDIRKVISSFVNITNGQIRVDIVHQKTKYRRLEAVAFGIMATGHQEIAVVLDTNVVVGPRYFLRVRAFVNTDATIFCPIPAGCKTVQFLGEDIGDLGPILAPAAAKQDILNFNLDTEVGSSIQDFCYHGVLRAQPLYTYRICDTSFEVKQ